MDTHAGVESLVVSMTDMPQAYDYTGRVAYEVLDSDLSSYAGAAEFLNTASPEVVCVQHEFGIFGGDAGSHLLLLLRRLNMPVVTTFHTVLSEPTPHQAAVMREIVQRSDRLIAISKQAGDLLRRVYGAPAALIDLIPHGIPDLPFVDPDTVKPKLGLAGKHVLLTFGLLGPGKGIERVIEALPAIVAARQDADVVYVVLGKTHPVLVRREGERYRESLQHLAESLGVAAHLRFENRFASEEELADYMGATDIYLTPYANTAQISSGTLAYAVGAGKAVISTPYCHARELLADGRGVLTTAHPADLAESVNALLNDAMLRNSMRRRAYQFGRQMIWSNVARQYRSSFLEAMRRRGTHPRVSAVAARDQVEGVNARPPLRLRHLRRMTDSTGLLQHAVHSIPDVRHGYCTDDNARALILTTLLQETARPSGRRARPHSVSPSARFGLADVDQMASVYMRFLQHAYDRPSGRFRNFMTYERTWCEACGSEDSQGRAMWALGLTAARWREPGVATWAAGLLRDALPGAETFTSPRAWSYVLLGVDELLRRWPGDLKAREVRSDLAHRLFDLYTRNAEAAWPWFEQSVTYCNARLPQALMVSGVGLGRRDMLNAGLESLAWLCEIQLSENDVFIPIGCDGFFPRGRERARFDQQPVEAVATIEACLTARQFNDDEHWLRIAEAAFQWFLGRNDLGLPLANPVTGGCRDGLHPARVNQNQGAESTLAYLISCVRMSGVDQEPSITPDDVKLESPVRLPRESPTMAGAAHDL